MADPVLSDGTRITDAWVLRRAARIMRQRSRRPNSFVLRIFTNVLNSTADDCAASEGGPRYASDERGSIFKYNQLVRTPDGHEGTIGGWCHAPLPNGKPSLHGKLRARVDFKDGTKFYNPDTNSASPFAWYYEDTLEPVFKGPEPLN